MKKHAGKTRLLVFTRTDEQEASAKALVPERRYNRAVAGMLIRHTTIVAAKTGLPVQVSFGDQQTGATFGERLANAVEDTFAKGYQNVIVIGNDCPSISPQVLRRAYRQMQTQGLVLGPATDGGVYLLGISASVYEREAFIVLPWETAHLQTGLEDYAEDRRIETSLLEPRSDVDDWDSLRQALNRLGEQAPLRRQIQGLLFSFLQPRSFFHSASPPSLWYWEITALRGPPAWLHLRSDHSIRAFPNF
jgi:glycosyltransferase A (GT-A) superfamily protein (DUF2064 family)